MVDTSTAITALPKPHSAPDGLGAQLILDMRPFFLGELESSVSVAADQTALTILNTIKVSHGPLT